MDRTTYKIQIPLPPKIDPSVTMMQVEEKPDVTYDSVGGCKEQIEKLREVVEKPLLEPERFVELGIDPPKGVLLYGGLQRRRPSDARADHRATRHRPRQAPPAPARPFARAPWPTGQTQPLSA